MTRKIRMGGTDLLTHPYDRTATRSEEAVVNSYHNGRVDMARDLAQIINDTLAGDELYEASPRVFAFIEKWAGTNCRNRSNGTGTEGMTRRRTS